MARVMKQDNALRERFQEQINKKIQADRETKKEVVRNAFGDIDIFGHSPFFEAIADVALNIREVKNQVKGNIGEFIVSFAANNLSDDWVVFNDVVLEPKPGVLTQVDHVLIGKPGMYLVETKAWQGSFTGYRDNWKRRDRSNWVPCSSPTTQSALHADAARQWIKRFNLPVHPQEFVVPVVVFTQAKWVRATNCSAPVFDNVSALFNYLHNEKPTKLTLEQVNQIAEMLVNPVFVDNISPVTQEIPKAPKPKLKPKIHDPEKAEGYRSLAMEKAKRGRYQEAIEDFTLAIKYNPSSAVAYKYRGIAHSRLSLNQEAIEDFQIAINLYEQQGQTAEAQELKERVAKL